MHEKYKLFPVFQRMLHRAVLLDNEARKYFHLGSVSVGPKKNQRAQDLGGPGVMCQEWENPAAGKQGAEKVYRIKVNAI